MTAILKVDTIQDTAGNNIINESSDTITIGAAGDTVDVPGTEVKTNKVSPTSGTALQIGDSGDTITIPSGATIANSGTATGFGGTNTPYFEAYIASNQTMSDNTTTKLNFDTETYDSGGMYDTTNKRFLPTVAGKYFIYFQVTYDKQAIDGFHNCHTYIKVNGSTHKTYYCDFYDNYTPYALVVSGHTIMSFNGSSDYVEIFGNFNVTSGTGVVNNASFSTFGAYKLIE